MLFPFLLNFLKIYEKHEHSPIILRRTARGGVCRLAIFVVFFKMAGKIVIFCSSASKNRILIGLLCLIMNISAGKIMVERNIFANYVKYFRIVHF